MTHARTIAMATSLLSDGRAEDVVSMVEPLLDPVTTPAASTGQILLRGLLARVEVVDRRNPARALEVLPEVEEVSSLCTCVRAEVALWSGWALALRDEAPNEVPKAARLLRDAQDLFASIHDARGRCWALLGRVYAYSELGEHAMGHRLLERSARLVDGLGDDQAKQWLHTLRTSHLRSNSPDGKVEDRSHRGRWETAKSQTQLPRGSIELAPTTPSRLDDHSEINPAEAVDGFVAESAKMQTIANQIRRLHSSRSPILITGEAGSGKRLVAEALHCTSDRAEGPLQGLSCAPTQQEEPLEARLFGSVNGAAENPSGAIHAANGGTLVIEDVDSLRPPLQSSLLQVLAPDSEGTTGSSQIAPDDIQIVATTTADLDALVEEGRLLPELRDCLRLISLHVPPLRERRADIPLLARHFLDALGPDDALVSITQPAMEALLRYNWPRNVRQLRNEIERALVYVQSEPAPTIDLNVLSDPIVKNARQVGAPQMSEENPDAILEPGQTLNDVLSQTEKSVIERVLRACDGQVTASADVLGLTRQGLYKKMKRLNIDASTFQSESNSVPTSS